MEDPVHQFVDFISSLGTGQSRLLSEGFGKLFAFHRLQYADILRI
jgi:hypothetical protein